MPEQPVDEQPKPGGTLRVAGLVGVGTGAVAVGLGVYFGLKARSLSNELSQPGAPYTPEKEDDGEAASRNMIIFTAVGGVLVVGGGVAYFVGRKQSASSGVALVPAWNSGPGFVVGGAF
jgi:hypothetical protein